jgi:hypothetical protein
MRHRFAVLGLLSGIIAAAAANGIVTFAQSKPTQRSPLQGVWRIVETTVTGPNARVVDMTKAGLGGLIIVTERHWSFNTETGDKPRPPLPGASATADDLRATWGPFDAQAGTYEMNGNETTLRDIAAKSPALLQPGAFIVVSFRREGDTAWITQVRSQAGPFPNPVTWKLSRLE